MCHLTMGTFYVSLVNIFTMLRVTEYACTTWMVQNRSLGQCDLLKKSKGEVSKEVEAATRVNVGDC